MSAQDVSNYISLSQSCMATNADRITRLVELIKHDFTRDHERNDTCRECRHFKRLGEAAQKYPWRDYSSDDPEPGDLNEMEE